MSHLNHLFPGQLMRHLIDAKHSVRMARAAFADDEAAWQALLSELERRIAMEEERRKGSAAGTGTGTGAAPSGRNPNAGTTAEGV